MCGIIGAIALRPGMLPARAVGERMNDLIRHRGPDDAGLFHDGDVMLGMRRLAIIDPASGQQPVFGSDRQVVAVFNGEIYNFRELREELEAAGHRFRTHSDSEVIVHAYERWGEAAIARLDGMFAIALWDRRRGRLLLARDRFGKKPLFIHERDGVLAFASELKSLVALPGFERTLDPDAVADYVTFGYVPTPRSIFARVRKLEPGHYLCVEGGRARTERYWELAYTPKLTLPEADAEATLAEHLERAVRMRLVSDVPFGAFLSGGLDSSIVVALMSRMLAQPVKTFSIGFAEARFNELEDARLIARHCGTEHHELKVAPDAVELAHDLAWYLDEPFADSSAIPTYLVAKMAAGSVKMVLTGDGGDELAAGYKRYAYHLALQSLGILRGPAAVALDLSGRVIAGIRGQRFRRVAERLRQSFPESYLSSVAMIRPALAGELLCHPRRDADHYVALASHFAGGGSELDRILSGDVASYLLDDILVKVDRMTMANSLEARAPLLDHHLFEFMARLPDAMKLRGLRGKRLLRQVARRWLPPAALDKPKQGFSIPLADWFRGPLRGLVGDLIESRAFRERGLLRPDAARRLLAQHAAGQADHAEPLWQVLMLELWARRYLDAPLAQVPLAEAANA
ncbi:MAG: asparagine synthase (glutamine-hydrolyzing) [Mizugakiibacter sp.]|uniref:asparagine synthase (glutamine-hydrolyzing) n=1 Tax=Mizugakiibacter sp. TaxID=1972610 RepID=UPI0031CC0A67|nr:asparagine synthase (glutamine-hydrolyzing) [Xanthomonadaceae bacterium]